MHHDLLPLTYISGSNDFVKIYFKLRINVNFTAAVIAMSMKPCIVIVFDILFMHDPVPLTFISHSINFVKIYVESTTKVHFSVAMSMKPCIVSVLDILFMHAP